MKSGGNIQHSPVEIAARGTFASPTTLTGAYVYSDVMASGKGRDQIALLVQYTKGDEASMELVIQYSDTKAFAVTFDGTYESVAGTGVVSPVTESFQWTATAKHTIFRPSAGFFCRVGVKATGGTPTGTCAIKIRFDTVSKGA